MKLYTKIGGIIQAIKNCEETNNQEWLEIHIQSLNELTEKLPHGAGIDGTTVVFLHKCRKDLIVIRSSYHCMDEVGGYDGWIDFELWIRPSFSGIDIDVKGRFSDKHGKYADIKDYLLDIFAIALEEDVDQ
jgi:hypothetical protein